MWTVIGACGIAGAGVGLLVERYEINVVHWTGLALLAAGIVSMGPSFSSSASTLVGGALFGASYLLLSGVYLVLGLNDLLERPATGLLAGFSVIAVGQTFGHQALALSSAFRHQCSSSRTSLLRLSAGLVRRGGWLIPRRSRLERSAKPVPLMTNTDRNGKSSSLCFTGLQHLHPRDLFPNKQRDNLRPVRCRAENLLDVAPEAGSTKVSDKERMGGITERAGHHHLLDRSECLGQPMPPTLTLFRNASFSSP